MKKSFIIALSSIILLGSGVGFAVHYNDNIVASKTSNTLATNLNENINSSAKASTYNESNKQNEEIPEVKTMANFTRVFNSLEELVQESEIIIEGKVLSTSSFDYLTDGGNRVYTKSEIKVTKVFAGSIKPGKELIFVEPGGVTTYGAMGIREKFKDVPEEDLKKNVKIIFNGVPNMKPNEKVILFGVRSDIQLLEGDYFITLGAHQGKLNNKNGKVSRHVPVNDSEYSSLNFSEEGLEKELKKLTK